MNDLQEAGIPSLMSIYTEKWSGNVSADADYSETDSEMGSDAEDLGGSSDEWEGDSESEMGTEEDEDADLGSEEGWVLTLYCGPYLIWLYRQDAGLTEDQLDMLQKHVSEFRAADLQCRFKIVSDCIAYIQEGWQSEATFNRKKVQKVCLFLITIGCSDMSLACSPVLVQ